MSGGAWCVHGEATGSARPPIASLQQGQQRLLPGGDVGQVIFDPPALLVVGGPEPGEPLVEGGVQALSMRPSSALLVSHASFSRASFSRASFGAASAIASSSWRSKTAVFQRPTRSV